MGRVGQFNLMWRSAKVPTPIVTARKPQHVTRQGYPIPPPGAHIPVALWAERLAPGPARGHFIFEEATIRHDRNVC